MPFINYAAKEINLKLVYYGPGLSGKTTNIRQIHARTAPGRRGALLELETESERTLFFDFMPVTIGSIRGFAIRLHIYSVPGQIFYAASRRLVMRGADGVVFVADSQAARLEATVESFENLALDLEAHGLTAVPRVIQLNRRDAPTALPLARLRRALDGGALPAFASVASRDEGVQETLQGITRLVLHGLAGGEAAHA